MLNPLMIYIAMEYSPDCEEQLLNVEAIHSCAGSESRIYAIKLGISHVMVLGCSLRSWLAAKSQSEKGPGIPMLS